MFPSVYGEMATAHGRCFLGSALPEVPVEASSMRFSNALQTKWPWVRTLRKYPCGCVPGEDVVAAVIAHVFDRHVAAGEWTREQLADWIRQIEPPEPSEAVAEEVPIGTAVTTHP